MADNTVQRIPLRFEDHAAPMGYYDPATDEVCVRTRWRGTNYWLHIPLAELIERLENLRLAPSQGMGYNEGEQV